MKVQMCVISLCGALTAWRFCSSDWQPNGLIPPQISPHTSCLDTHIVCDQKMACTATSLQVVVPLEHLTTLAGCFAVAQPTSHHSFCRSKHNACNPNSTPSARQRHGAGHGPNSRLSTCHVHLVLGQPPSRGGLHPPHDDLGAHVIQSVRALDNQLVMFTLPTITVMLTLPIITPG